MGTSAWRFFQPQLPGGNGCPGRVLRHFGQWYRSGGSERLPHSDGSGLCLTVCVEIDAYIERSSRQTTDTGGKWFPTEPSVVATAILGQGGDPSSLVR